MYSRFCARLSKALLGIAALLLVAVILSVQWQVFGRYILNDSPTWAESLALLLVLYVTAFGAAVGVRDGSHVGFETVAMMLPPAGQKVLLVICHAFVAAFGGVMAYAGWTWSSAKWGEIKPMLGVPDALDYLPLLVTGVLILLFSIEHIIAVLQGSKVEPSWN